MKGAIGMHCTAKTLHSEVLAVWVADDDRDARCVPTDARTNIAICCDGESCSPRHAPLFSDANKTGFYFSIEVRWERDSHNRAGWATANTVQLCRLPSVPVALGADPGVDAGWSLCCGSGGFDTDPSGPIPWLARSSCHSFSPV